MWDRLGELILLTIGLVVGLFLTASFLKALYLAIREDFRKKKD